jgi:hypothetical protein
LRRRYASVDPALTHAPDPLAEQALVALQQRHRELIEASLPIMAQARDLLSAQRCPPVGPHEFMARSISAPASSRGPVRGKPRLSYIAFSHHRSLSAC